MALIKFNDSTIIFDVKLSVYTNNDTLKRMKVTFNSVEDASNAPINNGFIELNEHNHIEQADYTDMKYTYIVNEDGLTYILTNYENDVYTEDSNSDYDNTVSSIELTDEEKAEIEKQNQINSLKQQVSNLKNQLQDTDYIIIKCQEYVLAGKEIPDEYDIIAFNNERDLIRTQINELEEQIEELSQ